MNPKHYEFLAPDRIAEMGRNAAGDQRLARDGSNAHVPTSAVGRRGRTSRALRPRVLKLGRLIARLAEG